MNGADGEMVIVLVIIKIASYGKLLIQKMPGYPNDGLDQSLINMIATWIDEGALNSVNCDDGFTYYQDRNLYPNVTIDDGTCFKNLIYKH